ncbi:MAG: hypothetical protein CJBNEKGG_01491 [Prosthecobacter sp.]|nr:hypothetical protein [Prosthecobacter sp.]
MVPDNQPRQPSVSDLNATSPSPAQMLLAEGRLEEALSAAKKSLEQARLGSQPDAVCRALLDLGDVRRAEGDPAKAEACYREGLEEPAGMTTLCALKMQLATLLDFEGREAEAVTFYEEAISGFESLSPQDELLLSQLRNNLAMIYKGLGRFAKAESLCVQALNALEQRLGHDTEEVASLYNNLGSIYYTAGFSEEARKMFADALTIREKLLPADHPDLAQSLGNLATACHELGDDTSSLRNFERALGILKNHLSTKPDSYEAAAADFAALLEALGKEDEAQAIRDEARRLLG